MTVLTLHDPNTGQFEAVDPIVSPGVKPTAHEHTFYGAKNITPNSTPNTLRGGVTSSPTAGDTAAMWVPTLFIDGIPVRGTKLHCGEYWIAPAGVKVEAPPAGMCFVAGNPHAMSPADIVPGTVKWHPQQGQDFRDAPFDVTPLNSGPLKYEVFFPNAWDGTGPDASGKIDPSHFAYCPDNKTTPAGFPHRIAQLGLQIGISDANLKQLFNPFDAQGNVRISFSSGPWYTAHADFMNSWDQAALQALVDGCLNKIGTCPPHV